MVLVGVGVWEEGSPQEFSLEGSDGSEGDFRGAFYGAGASVGAVAEAFFIHLGNHFEDAGAAFYLALR